VKYVDCIIIYAVVQYFKQFTGLVKTYDDIFVRIVIQRAFILWIFEGVFDVFLAYAI
jgi:hypothetical protein